MRSGPTPTAALLSSNNARKSRTGDSDWGCYSLVAHHMGRAFPTGSGARGRVLPVAIFLQVLTASSRQCTRGFSEMMNDGKRKCARGRRNWKSHERRGRYMKGFRASRRLRIDNRSVVTTSVRIKQTQSDFLEQITTFYFLYTFHNISSATQREQGHTKSTHHPESHLGLGFSRWAVCFL